MGTKLPLLPVHGESECKLFERLIVTMPSLDFDAMAIEWCKHVDGRALFPKLPVYLRTHHTKWLRNQRVRDAVAQAATGEAKLRALNLAMLPRATAATATVAPAAADAPAAVPVAAAPAPTAAAAGRATTGTAAAATTATALAADDGDDLADIAELPAELGQWTQPVIPPVMPQAPATMPTAAAPTVAGNTIGGVEPTTTANRRKGPGRPKGGTDHIAKRAKRVCLRCLLHKKDQVEAEKCPGRAPRGVCRNYTCSSCGKAESCRCLRHMYQRKS